MNDAVRHPPQAPALLPDGATWTVEGRLVEASNVVIRLLAVDADGSAQVDAPRAVFKPTAGERPLADFPVATLAHREVATWLVADSAGWTCVPETRWHVDEIGEGSLQGWVGPLVPREQGEVELLEEDEIDPAVHHPIAAFEGEEGILVLTHRDSRALRQVALLDLVTNNADRKGSHLVETDDGLYAIDHGLTFHAEDKVRTVLWGFAGAPFTPEESAALQRLIAARDEVTAGLADHLRAGEIDALFHRAETLAGAGCFPDPPADRYALPWPPL